MQWSPSGQRPPRKNKCLHSPAWRYIVAPYLYGYTISSLSPQPAPKPAGTGGRGASAANFMARHRKSSAYDRVAPVSGLMSSTSFGTHPDWTVARYERWQGSGRGEESRGVVFNLPPLGITGVFALDLTSCIERREGGEGEPSDSSCFATLDLPVLDLAAFFGRI